MTPRPDDASVLRAVLTDDLIRSLIEPHTDYPLAEVAVEKARDVLVAALAGRPEALDVQVACESCQGRGEYDVSAPCSPSEETGGMSEIHGVQKCPDCSGDGWVMGPSVTGNVVKLEDHVAVELAKYDLRRKIYNVLK